MRQKYVLDYSTQEMLADYLDNQLKKIPWENEDFIKKERIGYGVVIDPKYDSLGFIVVDIDYTTYARWNGSKKEEIVLLEPFRVTITIVLDPKDKKYIEMAYDYFKEIVIYNEINDRNEKTFKATYVNFFEDTRTIINYPQRFLDRVQKVMSFLRKMDELKSIDDSKEKEEL